MSQETPAQWTGTMALVRGFIFFLTASTSRLSVSGSISAKTGVAPRRTTALAEDTKLKLA